MEGLRIAIFLIKYSAAYTEKGLSGKTDATARGALMIAATILGMYTEIETAFAKIMSQNEEKIYYPEMESVLFYEQARERMNGFYTKIKE